MLISIEEDVKPDQKWNDRLIKSGLGTIYQTKEMGLYFHISNLNPKYLKFIDNTGEIVGQLLVEEFSRFKNKGKKGYILKNIPRLKKKLCKWVYGPIVFENKYASEIYTELGNFLQNKNCIVRGSQHPLSTEGIFSFKNKFNLIKWNTSLIDLTYDEQELYNKIDKHSGRKNIERAIKRDVIIEEANEKNILEFSDLYYMNKQSRHATKNELDDMKNWWSCLKPAGYSGFLTKKDDSLIGGIMFSSFNNYIIEGGVARSEKDTKMKLYSQDLIKWNIIQWGIKNNMKYYDLAGYNPNPQSEKEKGIMRYKKKWGGKNFEYWKILNK